MPSQKKVKPKNYPWDTRKFHARMRRTTGFKVTDSDDTHVYVSVSMNIPKAGLSLEREEALRETAEFGDKGMAYTLERQVRGYLHSRNVRCRSGNTRIPDFPDSVGCNDFGEGFRG